MRIDSKLKQGLYIKDIETKFVSQSLTLRRLGAFIQKVIFVKTKQIYTIVIRPAIIYGAVAQYFKIKNEEPKVREKKLKILQNQALRNITEAFKKVNTETLKAEIYVSLIYIILNKLQDQAILRIRITNKTRKIRKIYT